MGCGVMKNAVNNAGTMNTHKFCSSIDEYITSLVSDVSFGKVEDTIVVNTRHSIKAHHSIVRRRLNDKYSL